VRLGRVRLWRATPSGLPLGPGPRPPAGRGSGAPILGGVPRRRRRRAATLLRCSGVLGCRARGLGGSGGALPAAFVSALPSSWFWSMCMQGLEARGLRGSRR
jgi:hypothetical protein